MPTSYPLSSNANNYGLGSGGGGTEAPARVRAVVLIAADPSVSTPTAAQYAASPWMYGAASPGSLTGQKPGSMIFDTSNPEDSYWAKADGTTVQWMDNGSIVAALVVDSLDLGDNDPINFGDANDIVMQWNGTYFAVTQATVNSEIRLGVSGAGIDLQMFGDTVGADSLWDQSADSQKYGDNAKVVLGTGLDDTLVHNGTSTTWTHTTGDLSVINTAVTGFTILKSGTATSATGVKIVDSADQVQAQFLSDGSALVEGTLTAGGLTTTGTTATGALTVSGTQTLSDGSLLLQLGAGTGTGDKISCLGVDATHGIATYVYQDTVSPAAVETALFTVPAMSVVDSVQSNVQSALTGGGTTVTHSIGITGDVDAYGTASNSGVQADLLTQNAKINTLGTTTNAGASIGVWSAGTVSLKLIAAATGGASAGNTALTVGSVLVRVVYRTLLPLANA